MVRAAAGSIAHPCARTQLHAACAASDLCASRRAPHLPTGLQDLYKPEGPRLRRHLSAVLNFAMFREEKLAAYTALQEQLEGLLQVGGGRPAGQGRGHRAASAAAMACVPVHPPTCLLLAH